MAFLLLILISVSGFSEGLDINGVYLADINENPSFMLFVTQEWDMEYGFILLVPSDDPKIYRFEKKKITKFRFSKLLYGYIF